MNNHKSLVIIEDSKEDFYAISRILKSNNFTQEVIHFNDGDIAVEYLTSEGLSKIPGLILLDLNLPVLDGREVLKILKTNTTTRFMPIVISSTSSNPKDISFCYENGASGYFVKPVNLSHLEHAIVTMMNYWFSIMMGASPLESINQT